MESLKSLAKRIPLVRSVYSIARDPFKRQEQLRPLTAERELFVNYTQYRRSLFTKGTGRITLSTKDGLRITIRRNIWDARIVREIFIDKPYLQHCQLPSRPMIVDIGGYIGDFSIYCAKYLKPSKVVVYEPTLENYDVLLENVRLNGFHDVVVPVNKAVGRSGDLILNVQSLSDGEFHVSSYLYEGCEQRRVQSVSVGELYDTHNLKHVDLLKIDCEGGEYDIIPNAPNDVLKTTQNIVFEFHRFHGYEEKLNAAKERLLSAGFVLQEARSIISACRL